MCFLKNSILLNHGAKLHASVNIKDACMYPRYDQNRMDIRSSQTLGLTFGISAFLHIKGVLECVDFNAI